MTSSLLEATVLLGCQSLWTLVVLAGLVLCSTKKPSPAPPKTRDHPVSTKSDPQSMQDGKKAQKSVPEDKPKKDKSKPITTPKKKASKEAKTGGVPGSSHSESDSDRQSRKRVRGKGTSQMVPPNKNGYDDLNPNKKEDKDKSKIQSKVDGTKSIVNKDDIDGGYVQVDPNKNENREDAPMPAASKRKKAESKRPLPPPVLVAAENVKPKVMPRDAKQDKIAKGAKRGKGDYPTFDDVLSDWDSKKESKSKVKTPDPKDAPGKGEGEKLTEKEAPKSPTENTQSEHKIGVSAKVL